ncbi:Phosphocholine transferase AnkX [Wolbachia endosymbiont of Cylisticus convexus]|uniref:ankyrin repeat domain-containing protein n=1 Tax=Wolbachia endosymbiont of Cylisticus convexus TaxID=118728 RepID=UPI000DF70725|nr:ankyrin repeat domain-containing protein [Wolbachia endosymbiont of Cylisticus convexus]RDD35549.1 Phosphocholine transferase AnkX [Wolbachia endosymbiont of Cylisticus convexus]
MIESEFEVILQELERDSNIYSNDIATVIADELQEYSSRRSDEISQSRESIQHKMQLLNYDYNREIQSLSNDYNRKINLLKHKSDDELLKELYNNNRPNNELKCDTPDYDWEYRKHNNDLEYSKVKFDVEFKKYEEELKKLEQERHNIKHLMHEYDQWKKCGFNVNYVFKDSSKEFTLLHFAASFGDTNITKLLLEEGASIDIRDQNKNTLLHLAASNGHTDTVKFLVEKGSDLSLVNEEGNTSLHLAAFNGHTDTVKFLLDKGSDLSEVNKDGDTPLNTAFHNDQRETVKYLIEKEPRMKEVVEHLVKCVIESKAHKLLKGSTSLHLAAAYDCTEIVESLLEEGRNPLSKDINGKIPGELATDESLIQIFKAAKIKQQEYDATKWSVVSGVSAAALGTTIASTLFATVFTIGFLPIVGAVAAVTASSLAIGGTIYTMLKPNAEQKISNKLQTFEA